MSGVITDPTFTITPIRVSVGIASGIDWYQAGSFNQLVSALETLVDHHPKERCIIELEYGDSNAPLIRLYFNTAKVDLAASAITVPSTSTTLVFSEPGGLKPAPLA